MLFQVYIRVFPSNLMFSYKIVQKFFEKHFDCQGYYVNTQKIFSLFHLMSGLDFFFSFNKKAKNMTWTLVSPYSIIGIISSPVLQLQSQLPKSFSSLPDILLPHILVSAYLFVFPLQPRSPVSMALPLFVTGHRLCAKLTPQISSLSGPPWRLFQLVISVI